MCVELINLFTHKEPGGKDRVRGAPYHLMTQGKIERWHQTPKNRIHLENYFLPGDLEAQVGEFVVIGRTDRRHTTKARFNHAYHP